MNIIETLRNGAALRKENDPSSFIPYGVHLSQHTVTTVHGDYVQVLRLDGASFESADDEQVNSWHNSLNSLLRGIAASTPNLAIWKHMIRDEDNEYPQREFPPGFSRNLEEKYAARIKNERLMSNRLYLTIVYRPTVGEVNRFVMKLLEKTDPRAIKEERADSLDVIEKAGNELMQSLRRYDPQRLAIYQHRGINYSEVFEFFGYLINGEHQRIPLTRNTANKVLATSRPFFGQEALAIRTPTKTIYGAMLGIKEYPAETHPGFLNELLSTPFPYVLTQSFTFMQKEAAKTKLERAQNVLNVTGDKAVEQVDQITYALNDLVSNKFVMGEHHFNLLVKSSDQKSLTDNISIARSILNDTGMVVAREDLSLEAAYWAQLPGNFKYRPRLSPITSRNFAGFSPLHNYPSGRPTGNHWGDALAKLITDAGTSYYFSYHAADPKDEDGGSKKDVGHTMLLGPNGSGKTTVVNFMLHQMQAFGVTSVLLTKDEDSAISIRALGGKFYPIRIGEASGWNPMQLEPTKANIAFLHDFVTWLRRGSRRASKANPGEMIDPPELTQAEKDELISAINSVMRMDKAHRRLRRVLDFLDATKPDGNYANLRPWCHAHKPGDEDGQYCWVFDNPEDTVIDSLGDATTIGFDTTQYIENAALVGPINQWLFFLANTLIDGRRFALHIAEFWRALDDPRLAYFTKDALKTIRKQNGFVVLDSQSPTDAINHPIGRTLIEQTPTKILFPNVEARRRDYVSDEGLNLSEREYLLIKEEIPEGSRKFLIKQGHNSVVAQLDLKGFDFEISVLSARKHTIKFMNELIEQYGPEPEQWLPHFDNVARRKA